MASSSSMNGMEPFSDQGLLPPQERLGSPESEQGQSEEGDAGAAVWDLGLDGRS